MTRRCSSAAPSDRIARSCLIWPFSKALEAEVIKAYVAGKHTDGRGLRT